VSALGCGSRLPTSVESDDRNAPCAAYSCLALDGVIFDSGVLEGQLTNRSGRAVREATIEVTFRRANGDVVLKHDFRVLPGGDGRALDRGYVKHFKYAVQIDRWPQDGSISARIRNAVWVGQPAP
jgi:hypothetical protein